MATAWRLRGRNGLPAEHFFSVKTLACAACAGQMFASDSRTYIAWIAQAYPYSVCTCQHHSAGKARGQGQHHSQDRKTGRDFVCVVQTRKTIPRYPLSQSRFDVVRVHHLLRLQHVGASCHSKLCAGTGDARHSLGCPTQAVVSKSTGLVRRQGIFAWSPNHAAAQDQSQLREGTTPHAFHSLQWLPTSPSAVLLQLRLVTGDTVPKR